MSAIDTIMAVPRTLKDRALKDKLQELRRTDNITNWFYLARAYAIIVAALILAIGFHQWQMAAGISFWWNVPVFFLAIVVIGASQHQLAGATHEATHHILFRNRLLNELASDWLCMFPLFSSTYIFRLHHLAHHQFINDPERDPDFSQLQQSGHWLKFPVLKGQFLWTLFKQITLVPLIRYILVRAKYNAIGVDNNPYLDNTRTFSPWPIRIAIFYLFAFLGLMVWSSWQGHVLLLAVLPVVGFAVVLAALLSIPGDRYPVTRLHPVISAHLTLISRVAFVTLGITAMAWAEYLTQAPVWAYFFLLWVAPIFTTFSFFMILRQLVQHGNGDRGWLTNTRTFLVHPFIRYAVFPFGMDYHLPHHMFATVPHYRLPELHAFLLQYPEYVEKGLVVEGYFVSPQQGERRNPTVIEVVGPDYARNSAEVFIDHSVLDDCRVDRA